MLNLIEVTADEIVRQGGPRPTVLATPATINSMAYLKAIDESAEKLGSRDERMTTSIGAPNWAPYINKFDEMYNKPETRAIMMADITTVIPAFTVTMLTSRSRPGFHDHDLAFTLTMPDINDHDPAFTIMVSHIMTII